MEAVSSRWCPPWIYALHSVPFTKALSSANDSSWQDRQDEQGGQNGVSAELNAAANMVERDVDPIVPQPPNSLNHAPTLRVPNRKHEKLKRHPFVEPPRRWWRRKKKPELFFDLVGPCKRVFSLATDLSASASISSDGQVQPPAVASGADRNCFALGEEGIKCLERLLHSAGLLMTCQGHFYV